jgi:hypothetical protein
MVAQLAYPVTTRVSRLVLPGYLQLRRLLFAGLCVAATLAVYACQDVQDNPLALAVASETHGAVLFAEELPSLPRLLGDNGMAGEGSAEADAWWESWRLGGAEGAQLRSLVYSSAIQRLYPVLGDAGVGEFLKANDERLSAAGSARSLVDSESIGRAFERATGLHGEAWAALSEGNGEEALLLALRSVDVLWEVTPEQVALELVERAHDALRRNEGSVPYTHQELTRIRRLMNGAREALGEGDHPLAIRRAFYACQLLGAEVP